MSHNSVGTEQVLNGFHLLMDKSNWKHFLGRTKNNFFKNKFFCWQVNQWGPNLNWDNVSQCRFIIQLENQIFSPFGPQKKFSSHSHNSILMDINQNNSSLFSGYCWKSHNFFLRQRVLKCNMNFFPSTAVKKSSILCQIMEIEGMTLAKNFIFWSQHLHALDYGERKGGPNCDFVSIIWAFEIFDFLFAHI